MAWFKRKESKPVKVDTFTKVWVNRTLTFSWVCIFWCFLLATIGKDQVAENLAVAIVMNIVGVFVGYLAKSFFETREEKRMAATLSNGPKEDNGTINFDSDVTNTNDEFVDV